MLPQTLEKSSPQESSRRIPSFKVVEPSAILFDIFSKYGAEDLGSEYGEKWWKEKITFFYPGHMMDIPQMFGTMDSIATYSNIEKIYWAMKEAIETNFPMARFIAHFSHWYEWGAMIYDRFIVDNPPQDPHEALRLHNQIWYTGVRAALANGGVVVTGNEVNNARARAELLSMVNRGFSYTPDIAEVVYECALCGACTTQCCTGFDPLPFTRQARMEALSRDIAPEYVNSLLDRIESEGSAYPPASNPELLEEVSGLPEKAEILLFLGNTASGIMALERQRLSVRFAGAAQV